MISVVCVTNRIGGLDVLFDSIGKQTEKDFELILVDSIRRWRARADLYQAHFDLTDMWARTRVIEPRDNPFPMVAYSRTVNTGIAHARGETIVLLCDYSWLHPKCLETHAEMQKKHRAPVHLDYDYRALPPLKAGFPFYNQDGFSPEDDPFVYTAALNATTDRYVADLEARKLDAYMWSIFEEPLAEETVKGLPVTLSHRPCATREADDWNWCSFKNESFPTELWLAMNGLDEAYDECHCYQDQEFSYRLKEAGIRWVNGPAETGMVSVINPRPVLNVKKLPKQIGWNRILCDQDRKASKRLAVNPGFSLREWRNHALGEGFQPFPGSPPGTTYEFVRFDGK